MRFYYSDLHDLNLPAGHRFPGNKYGLLRQALLAENIVADAQLKSAPFATDAMLERAHDPNYIRAIETGEIDPAIMRRIGFAWSAHIARRARATMGGAVAAAYQALAEGISGQLAGGTHHAHYDHGAGYCVFNDFAVAALDLLAAGAVERVAIIDLDVHQGDGNAALLTGRNDVFVYSMHGEKNFPFRKVASDLDVALEDHADDDAYLRALDETLPAVWAFKPDIILYQAGVDPLKEDRLGRLDLSANGLLERDRMVIRAAKARGIAVSMAIGGGYADPIAASVAAYANTYKVAKEVWRF